MANKCDYCGKGTMYGQNVSHAKNKTKRLFKPNLHQVNFPVNGEKTKLRLCTRCLRTLKKKQPPSTKK